MPDPTKIDSHVVADSKKEPSKLSAVAQKPKVLRIVMEQPPDLPTPQTTAIATPATMKTYAHKRYLWDPNERYFGD